MTRFLIFNCLYLYNYFFRISVKRNWEYIWKLRKKIHMEIAQEAIIIIIIDNDLKQRSQKISNIFCRNLRNK